MLKIPVIDRYIIAQIIRPLVAAMAIGLALLLSERMVRLLDLSMGKQNSFGFVFEALAYLIPHYLGLALPAAMFLGLLFGFNKLSKDSEVDAFLAAGIGHHRLVLPVVLLSTLLALVTLVLFGWIQPHARYAYRSVIFNVKNVEVFFLAEEGVFMQAGRRTFILDKLSRKDSSFKRIFLFEDNGKDGIKATTAVNGRLLHVPGHRRPVLRLENGHQLQLSSWPDLKSDAPLPRAFVSTFATLDTPVGRLSQKVFPPRGSKPSELTLSELFKETTSPSGRYEATRVSAALQKKLVNVATIFILPFLALPFAMGRRRGQRGYRFGIALIILVAFHEVVEVGLVAIEEGRASAFLAIWVPFLFLAAFSFWRFWRLSFVLGKDRLEGLVDWLAGKVAQLRGLISKKSAAS